MDGDRVSVERVIDAPAHRIFELLADAGQHPKFDGSGSVDHSTADSVPLSLGSVFSMRMKGRRETLFLPYTMSNKVIEFQKDRRIAWQPTALGGLIGGRIWRYVLTPAGTDSTLVREEWDISQDKQKKLLRLGAMPEQAERGMRATLDRIAQVLNS
jgi:uncharacterized protein YndB with AHSA1/START domain